MDLIDLIGDSRTDSLPPGFLRSIKIKYKQEASHVFPKGEKPKTAGEPADRAGSATSAKSTPVSHPNSSNNSLSTTHTIENFRGQKFKILQSIEV